MRNIGNTIYKKCDQMVYLLAVAFTLAPGHKINDLLAEEKYQEKYRRLQRG